MSIQNDEELHQLTPLYEAEKARAGIKPEFEERYRILLGSQEEYERFLEHSLSYMNKSVRVNTLKKSIPEVKKALEAQGFRLYQVPWCAEGFWVKGERTDLGNLTEHFLGYIYIQEAASMLPATVLKPQPDELVLDMCASPGSKTTQMAALMGNTGLLVANDISGNRMKPLGLNLQRIGTLNTVVTIMHGQQFNTRKIIFDKVLVDAPCSGTGTIRKSVDTLKVWNPGMIKRLSNTQKTLIETGFRILKEGGEMVYSTCSVEPEENEEVVDHLLKRFPNARLEPITLQIKRAAPIEGFEDKTYSKEVQKCLRIWPQDNNTEGFFVAKIKKIGASN